MLKGVERGLVLLGRVMIVAALAMTGRATDAQAQSTGGAGISGIVRDASTAEPLPGAKVTVPGSAAATSTERDGTFLLGNVAAGPQKIIISYLGRQDEQLDIDLTPGLVRTMAIELKMLGFEESVAVTTDLIRDAQARALNQQKTAPNITNIVSADQIGSFPDRNAAETLQRIPGIAITKDQGEGRYVQVRGTDARLNSMMIDGQRIPSPDPLLRQVALDVVPSELLQAIEVSKALTPDMEADAIGGSVNLVTKAAPGKLRVLGSIGGGYNQMLSNWDQNNYSIMGGGRFDSGRIGAIFSAAGSRTNRGTQDVEATYTATLGLNELNPRYYQVDRGRVGFTGALDFKPTANQSYTIRGVFNRFIDDHENRQRLRLAVGNSRIDRELRDRTHIERITSLGLTGHTIARGATTIDYQLLGAYSDQTDPMTMTTTFRETRVTFAPNVSPTAIDPDNVQANPQNDNANNYTFLNQLRATNFAKDRDVVGSFDVRTPLRADAGLAAFIKFGAKYRDKAKGRDRNEVTYTTASTLKMTDFIETGFDLPPYLDGRYDLTPYLSQRAVAAIPDLVPTTAARNAMRDTENFDGTERTAAAYVMTELYVGGKWLVLPGVRFEQTAADFTGRTVRLNGSNGLGTDPVEATASYGIVLPGINVRYAATADTNLRFAVTRSLARPNYSDIVPYYTQDDTAAVITLGNETLQPTRSWNVDLLGEHYFKTVGVVSAGLFYKRLADYIYTFSDTRTINNVLYQVTQPRNGDEATVRGLELAVQNQLSFLPGVLNGIGVYANYTFTDSAAAVPGHDGDSRLPGQAKHAGNVAVAYETRGFSGRLSLNFHGAFVDAAGATTLLDRVYDTNRQLDLSLSQRVSRNLHVYFDGLNLNNALLRYYQGVPERVLQEEHYQSWFTFGMKANF